MKLDLNIILMACCDYYEQEVEDVRSSSRLGELIEVRQMYCYIAKVKHRHKLVPIGKLINRDHSSVLYSAKAIDIQLDINNVEVREDYIAIIDSMEGDNIKISIAMANQRIEKRKRENKKDKDLIKKLSTY